MNFHSTNKGPGVVEAPQSLYFRGFVLLELVIRLNNIYNRNRLKICTGTVKISPRHEAGKWKPCKFVRSP